MSKTKGNSTSQAAAAAAAPQEDLKTKEKLQSILVAETYDSRFYPATSPDVPPSLLPLTSSRTTLLDHALELVASNGVQECFVACGSASASAVAAHVRQSRRWTSAANPKFATVVESPDSVSVGDLLRDIFGRGLITSPDFVLVFGDVVSNVNLENVIKEHRARREKDRSCIMTILFNKTGVRHPTRSPEDESMVVVDSETGQIVQYECSAKSRSTRIPVEAFSKHPSVQVHYDLMDPGIMICSLEVLQQLQDNFDYRSITPDLVKGVIDHADLLNYKIFAHVTTGYAACVRDLRTYMSISRDVVRRWVFPLVPDNNFLSNTSFAFARNLVYREAQVKCLRGAVLEGEVAVGEGTVVEAAATVARSTIGRHCAIGGGARVRGSIVWDGVRIGQNAVVEDSLVCENAQVLEGAVVPRGCVIGRGVIVGRYKSLVPFTKLTADDEDEAADPAGKAEETELGDGGSGFSWHDGPDMPYSNTLIPQDEREAKGTWESEESSEDEDAEAGDGDEEGEEPEESMQERLCTEVADLVDTALQELCPPDEFHLQIRGLRMTYNTTWSNCGGLIVRKLLDHARQGAGSGTQNELVASIRKTFRKWGALVTHYAQTQEDQVELLCNLQEICRRPPFDSLIKPVFAFVVHSIYDSDLVSEDAIWAWVEKQKQPDAPADATSFIQLCDKFLTWLKTADEEEDD